MQMYKSHSEGVKHKTNNFCSHFLVF